MLGKHGILKLFLVILSPVGLIGGAIIIGLIVGGVISGNFDTIWNKFFPTTEAGASSTRTLVSSIQPLGQLVSISRELAKANINVGVQAGVGNVCGYSGSFVAEGTIRAGIDLSQITETDLRYDQNRKAWVLSLPHAQLTSCSVDYIDQYNNSTILCPGVDWDEIRQIANYTALTDFRNDSIEDGIGDQAEQQAKIIIGNFVKLVTGSEVEIVYTDKEVPIDRTCQPEPPMNWKYDETNKNWTKS